MKSISNIWRTLSRWFSIPWYPIVFSGYPVLALLASNVGQVKLDAGWRSLLVCMGMAGILFISVELFLYDWNRAAFLSTLWMILFFSYGHIYNLLMDKLEGFDFKNWLWLAWLLLFAISVLWARQRVPSPGALNVIVLGLVVTSLMQVGSRVPPRSAHDLALKNAPIQDLSLPQNPPDVYYFILDMYTREDLLKSYFKYDNSGFISELASRGFYVAQCSQSNYTRTELSVTSSLNMTYLQGLDEKFVPNSISRARLWDALKHSAVRYNFEKMGYRTISYATGFAWSELDDADVFITPSPFALGMTSFETLFLQTTLARQAQDWGWLDADQIMGQNYRNRHMLVFNSMDDVTKMAGPKFVYVHLIMPHPPFVFGPNGEFTNPADFWNEKKTYPTEKFKAGYVNQINFLNQKMLETVDTILSGSKTPPIIILQGDHGPWAQPNPQHFFILNAYYLPGHNDELYPTISPVNTFRLVFNDYFGGSYDMLNDETYYSPVPKLYNFSKVPYPCN